MPSRTTATEIVARLRQAGFETYLAGGCVRDMLLGRAPSDYDVATAAKPDEVGALFCETVRVGAAFGVVQVVVDHEGYEVATFRTEGPYLDGRHPSSVRYATAREDALRRDFTVNGMFWDPSPERLLDFVGGQADLRARLIRTIGDPEARFSEDGLRMLRAVRQAAELGFQIVPETLAAIRRMRDGLARISPERVREELVRIVTGPDAARALGLLHVTGLLEVVLPEVAAEANVPQPEEFHPEGDVLQHTRLVVGGLEAPTPTLAMAALLHDVGKPPTLVRAGRIRFDRHDEVGAELARAVMERLRFPRRDVDRVASLVRQHMIFKDVPRMREARLRRLLDAPEFEELLDLHRADCMASHGDLSTYEWVRRRRAEIASQPPPPPRLVTGDDLLALGVPPGPRVGDILRSLDDARLEGHIRNREEAIALARRLAAEP
ncbi:MAG TPA: CCA tRNA nucleotidyltransferase [bacterium]|nr:CCA tRNA nucleotidyltransferase [bacterium]